MGPVGGMFPGMVVGVPEGEIEGGEWGDMDIFIDGEGWFVADFEGVADSMDEDDPPPRLKFHNIGLLAIPRILKTFMKK